MNEMFDLLLGYCHYETPTILSKIQKSWIAAVIIVNTARARPSNSIHSAERSLLSVQYLLFLLPEIDLTIKSKGRNLLHLAVLVPQKRSEIIDVLLDKGVDILERSDSGGTIFHYLFRNRHTSVNKDLDICQRFIASGCDIEVVDNEGVSLMHVLFEDQSHRLPNYEDLMIEILEILLEAEEVNVNVKDRQGNTPLLQFLELRNGRRSTPLLLALDYQISEVAKSLVKEGPNVIVKCRDERQYTSPWRNVLWYACKNADKELVGTFLSKGLDINNAIQWVQVSPSGHSSKIRELGKCIEDRTSIGQSRIRPVFQ
ncbi:ankyrin [Hyaloscypha hepaticicola]|uniref:Ankyrin n=1 Tax=Hyaloscypha hepaticicola TaxID=2082293 RepID=A0A2J6Q1H9_9HELO|nr:ankyrin [Hyaloscypha hepaticicola]